MTPLQIVSLVLVLTLVGQSYSQDEAEGTTPGFEHIFMGRCWELQMDTAPSDLVDCEHLWDVFESAIAYQDPCKIPLDAYDGYVAAVPHQLPADKTVFWSGTGDIAHPYTKTGSDGLLTLEDTLLGYMVDGLNWCSSTDNKTNGLDYETCPGWWVEDCDAASTAFYTATSAAIGQQAQGVITVMLDGSREDGAFRDDSFFGTTEFPNLDPEVVTRADIIVVLRNGEPMFEKCSTGSVAKLEEMFAARGIKTTCTDDDQRVIHIQCSYDSTSPECKLARSPAHGPFPDHWYFGQFIRQRALGEQTGAIVGPARRIPLPGPRVN